MLTFTIKGQKLELDTPLIVAETMKYLTATFSFSNDWNGITEKILHYQNANGEVFDKAITENAIADADNFQLSEGMWKLYLHGIDDNGRRITTSPVYVDVKPFGSFEGEVYPTVPQHVIDQLLLLIKTDGDGTLFLADDGMYKGVTVSSEEIALAVERYLEQHPVTPTWGSISGNLENQTDLTEVLSELDDKIEDVDDKVDNLVIPSALADLTEDSTHRVVTDAEKESWNGKQDALVSGTNIKTINGETILGSGNIVVQGGGGGAVNSVNGKTGDVTLTASDVSALPNTTDIPTMLSQLSSDVSHRTVTDAEKLSWNGKLDPSSVSGLASQTYVDNAIQTAIGNAIGGVY